MRQFSARKTLGSKQNDESRIAKLSLNAAELPKFDSAFKQMTYGEERKSSETLKFKWAALEALVSELGELS